LVASAALDSVVPRARRTAVPIYIWKPHLIRFNEESICFIVRLRVRGKRLQGASYAHYEGSHDVADDAR